MNSQLNTSKMIEHYGHDIVIVKYGNVNFSLECENCQEVLADCDKVIK